MEVFCIRSIGYLPINAIQSTSTSQETTIASVSFIDQWITSGGTFHHGIQFDDTAFVSILIIVDSIRIITARKEKIMKRTSVSLIHTQFSVNSIEKSYCTMEKLRRNGVH